MPADALTRIRARGPIGIRLGLERMRALLRELGDPHHDLHGVLIGGTNGKGSCAAMVSAMLGTAGYSTAQSPSPHLSDYRERILIDGRAIAARDFDALLDEVLQASSPGEAEHGPATEFELLTAAAWLWAERRGVDALVMEVGLGGRLDASNTWHPEVAAITSVGLDHQEYLGDTIASVAAEKAAIIKAGSQAVTGASGEALSIIEARAREVGAPLAVRPPLHVEGMDLRGLRVDHPILGSLRVPLLGRHQAGNAAVALGIIEALAATGVASVTPDAIRAGLAATRWPGRLELLAHRGVTVLLDGAHNPDGAAALAATIGELAPELPRGRPTLLVGVMADKAVAEIVAALASSGDVAGSRIVATRVPDSTRGMLAVDLLAAWRAEAHRAADGEAIEDVDAALERALGLARAEGGLLIVTGSLYLVGHVRPRLVMGPEDG